MYRIAAAFFIYRCLFPAIFSKRAAVLRPFFQRRRCLIKLIKQLAGKKFEAARHEFDVDGKPNVDAVLTTKGLIRMIKEAGILFEDLEPEAVDMPFGTVSGAGVIFGTTGGVTEAVLRRVMSEKTRAELLAIEKLGQRGTDGIKEFDLPVGEGKIHIAVVSGLANAEKVIKRMKKTNH